MLVAHFRAITRGYVPFDLDWNIDQTTAMAGGDKEALEYMRNIGSKVKNLGGLLSMSIQREKCSNKLELHQPHSLPPDVTRTTSAKIATVSVATSRQC